MQLSKHSFHREFVNSSWVIEFNEKNKYLAKIANFTNKVLHINKLTNLVIIEPAKKVNQKAEYVNTT